MHKPLIGLSTYLAEARWNEWAMPAALLPAAYGKGIQAAGGLAVMLPPDVPTAAASAIASLDGLVLAGGEDLDPALYGKDPHPRTEKPVPERDSWERALLTAALERDIPVLGICRGMQLMNVHAGGTLIQHLPDRVGHEEHGANPGRFTQHRVEPVPGTHIAEWVPRAAEVASHHHQAVEHLGTGVVAAAYAEDGTIEAIEFSAERFALGVQWHPEMGADMRVIDGLVAVAHSGRTSAATGGPAGMSWHAPGSRFDTSVPSASRESVLGGQRQSDGRSVTVPGPAS